MPRAHFWGHSLGETIAAISSPPGPAARAILRLSGDRALLIGAGLCQVKRPSARSAVPGRFEACGASCPALLLAMPGPKSYTREDVAEIHLPGAAPIAAEALKRALAAGAREALPGEFTRRAVENGRISIAQAEAVMDVIRASDDAALRRAASRLAGRNPLAAAADRLAGLVADVEASIDFVEHDVPCVPREEVVKRASALAAELETVSPAALDDAPRAVLAGPPNAGKTSLFNALTGGRGLVSAVPGTTRDALESDLVVGATTVRLADSPGDAEYAPGPDAEAAKRGREARRSADIVVHVRDGSRPFEAPSLDRSRELLVLNKADIATGPGFRVSAITGAGLPRLRARIALLARRRTGDGAGTHGAREAESARRAAEALRKGAEAAAAGQGDEFVALELREALDALGEATSPVPTEELLDRVFAKFCVGK